MRLDNEFTVPVSLAEAWQVLLDVERIAPCMPGATLTSVEGEEFTGTVKVKVGPIQVLYKGAARFLERDEASHRAVIEASGKEARGSGTAGATVTAALHESGAGTRVTVTTDLDVTGKPAQFGRGVMADVAGKLIQQFADCLARELEGASTAAAAPAPTAVTSGTAAVDGAADRTARGADGGAGRGADPAGSAATAPRSRPSPEAIDLLGAAGSPVLKRLAPAALVLLVLIVLGWRRRRGGHG